MDKAQLRKQLQQALSGSGNGSASHVTLLILYYAKAATIIQLQYTGIYSTVKHCRDSLKKLVSDGYVRQYKAAIPPLYEKRRGQDLFMITEEGEEYIRCFLSSDTDIHVTSSIDPAAMQKGGYQFLYDLGCIDFFTAMLPELDENGFIMLDTSTPYPSMPPSRRFEYVGPAYSNIRKSYTCFFEMDLKMSVEDLYNVYKDTCRMILDTVDEEDDDFPLVGQSLIIGESPYVTVGSSLSGVAETKVIRHLKQADTLWRKERGDRYTISLQELQAVGVTDTDPTQEHYTQADITLILKNLRKQIQQKKADLELQTAAAATKEIIDTRFSVGTATMYDAWAAGFQTIILPTGYIRQYLPVCYPLRYGLQKHLGSIGFNDKYIDASSDPVLYVGEESIICPALIQTYDDACLVVENISNDISGRYRVQWLYEHNTDATILLVAASMRDVSRLSVNPDTRTYVLLYENIWNQTYAITPVES